MQKHLESKVFRDPLYGNITIKYVVISKLIDTKEFQRLRRIRQLAGVSMIYPGAEHSRFSHSLGVYHLAYQFIRETELESYLTEREQLLFLVSALLHDIGHGPYSHAFEDVFNTKHEEIGSRIILTNKNINSILNEVDADFAADISDILLGKSKYLVIQQLISSQLDVDRLDYLMRDTYYTGASYGNIDTSRIMRVMKIVNDKVVFKVSGISAIENYLISRYHMYWQVYFHVGTRAYELILEKIYLRVKDLIEKENFKGAKLLKDLNNNPEDLETYLKIDDNYINGLVSEYRESDDQILKVLANDFINRNIWENTEAYSDLARKIKAESDSTYLKYFTQTTTAYELTYQEDLENLANNIYILKKDGTISTLALESEIIKSLLKSGVKSDERFFFRKKWNKYLLLKVKMMFQD